MEVPVEPWEDTDFRRIADKGSNLLNITFSSFILQECIENAFNSVGVFQELLKVTCQEHGLIRSENQTKLLSDEEAFERAIDQKTEEYSGRHLRNLEAIASCTGSSIPKDGPLPYFLHYYIVMHILKLGFDGINGGVTKEALMLGIREIHHRREDLKGSLLTNALKSLTAAQSTKGICPPVIAYDSNSRLLKVIDSTFYFFLKNANLEQVKDEIVCPLDGMDG